MGVKFFYSHKWPTVFVDDVKRKPRNFEAYLSGSLYPTFTTFSYHINFITNGYRTLFKGQRVPLKMLTKQGDCQHLAR